MRDINRIKPFLEKVEELWQYMPDMRFGQIMEYLYQMGKQKFGYDPYQYEEEQWTELINELIKRMGSIKYD